MILLAFLEALMRSMSITWRHYRFESISLLFSLLLCLLAMSFNLSCNSSGNSPLIELNPPSVEETTDTSIKLPAEVDPNDKDEPSKNLVTPKDQPFLKRTSPNLMKDTPAITELGYGKTWHCNGDAGIDTAPPENRDFKGNSLKFVSDFYPTYVGMCRYGFPVRGQIDEQITVEPGKTYTFSAYMRTSKDAWPSNLRVSVSGNPTTSTGYTFIGNCDFFSSAPDIWEENVCIVKIPEGVTKVWLMFYKNYNDTARNKEATWLDNFYFGEGVGFDQPPAKKRPFDGSIVKVDGLGNIKVKRGEEFKPFFPFCIYQSPVVPPDTVRTLLKRYADQGFNCISRVSPLSDGEALCDGLANARTDTFRDGNYGMMQYLHIADQEASIKTIPTQKIADGVKKWPCKDRILTYYMDVEDPNTFNSELIKIGLDEIKAADTDENGKRMHPIFMNHYDPGWARLFNTWVDTYGTYMNEDKDRTHNNGRLFMVADNLQNQDLPLSLGVITNAYNSKIDKDPRYFRMDIYSILISGAKGASFFVDPSGYMMKEDYDTLKVPASPIDCTVRVYDQATGTSPYITDKNHCVFMKDQPVWNEIPKLRHEIDQMMDLIQQPHWTEWKVTSDQPEVYFGTRNLNNEGYMIIVNTSETATLTTTFTISGLVYTPVRVLNFFDNSEIATFTGDSFQVTLEPMATAVYKIARP